MCWAPSPPPLPEGGNLLTGGSPSENLRLGVFPPAHKGPSSPGRLSEVCPKEPPPPRWPWLVEPLLPLPGTPNDSNPRSGTDQATSHKSLHGYGAARRRVLPRLPPPGVPRGTALTRFPLASLLSRPGSPRRTGTAVLGGPHSLRESALRSPRLTRSPLQAHSYPLMPHATRSTDLTCEPRSSERNPLGCRAPDLPSGQPTVLPTVTEKSEVQAAGKKSAGRLP